MKRYIAWILVFVMLLAGCGTAAAEALPAETAPAPDADAFRFTEENFPRMDGSTSLVPLGQGIASVLLGGAREELEAYAQFNRTTQSFRNLQEGSCDVVIAAEPKKEVFDEMRENAFPYLMETIAKEALVFVVNEDNPVNSLTSEQVRGIYSGTITNWKEVGGEDAEIKAFQRNPTAGSQVMMEKLVMKGTPMMAAPTTRIPQEMAGLIDAVRSFDGSANAIGYTVFYYASDMQMAKGLKLLKIDGVVPSAETIRSGEYPYINGYYCCISAAAAADSPERRLFDWLITDAGQTLLALEGYVPVSAPGTAEDKGTNVYTDYSHYVPFGGIPAKFTEFDCPHDHLEPGNDYGLIFPYDGAVLYGSWEGAFDDYRAGTLQGFYNEKGQQITNPLYTSVTPNFWDDRYGSGYVWVIGDHEDKKAVVTSDGSILTEFCYEEAYTLGKWVVAVRDYENGIFDLLDSGLSVVKTQEDFRFDGHPFLPSSYRDGLFTGVWMVPEPEEEYPSYPYAVVDEQGNKLLDTEGYLYMEDNGSITCYAEEWRNAGLEPPAEGSDPDSVHYNYACYDSNMNRLWIGEYDSIDIFYSLNQNYFYAGQMGEQPFITDAMGNVFAWDFDDCRGHYDGSLSIIRGDVQTIYDAAGRVLYTDVPAGLDYLGDGIFTEDFDGGIILHCYPGDKTAEIPNGYYAFRYGELFLVSGVDEDYNWFTRVLDKDMNLSEKIYEELIEVTDPYTGKQYLLGYNGYGFAGEQRMYSADLQQELLRANGVMTVFHDHIIVLNDWAFTSYDLEGNVVFCYPFFGTGTGD